MVTVKYVHAAALVLCVAAILAGAPPSWAEAPDLFYEADASAYVRQVYAYAHYDNPALVQARFAGVRTDLLAQGLGALDDATWIRLELFDGSEVVARLERTEGDSEARFLWEGTLEGIPGGRAAFAVVNQTVAGVIEAPGWGLFELRYAGEGVHVLTEIDPASVPACTAGALHEVDAGGATHGGSRDEGSRAEPGVTSKAGSPEIDLLVLYTPASRDAGGGGQGMQSLIDLAIANTNAAYANSGVSQRVRLAGSALVNYTESGNVNTDLNRLTNAGDGYMDEVHGLRNTHGADLVTLLVNTGNGAGVAWIMQSPSSSFQSNAFSVVRHQYAASVYVLAHELGHNMGCAHEPGNGEAGAYSYSRAYAGDSYRTVMYSTSSSQTIPYFSGPSATYNGQATGTNSQNNARALNETASIVAGFRQPAFTVSPSSRNVGNESGVTTFNTQYGGGGSATWRASVLTQGADWVSFPNGSQGTNSQALAVAYAENTTGGQRSATVRFMVTGDISTAVDVTVNQGVCAGPAAPAGVSASDGAFAGFVRVTWNSVGSGAEYRVYRGNSNDPNTASAVSGWLTAASFDDTSAAPPSTGGSLPNGSGCNAAGGFKAPVYHYYWVQARNTCTAGPFSASDRGHRGEAKTTGYAGVMNGDALGAMLAYGFVAGYLVWRRSPHRRRRARSVRAGGSV
jgi:peptidyl-Asp metalloendopeptidase